MSTAEDQRKWRARHGARTGVRGRVASAPCGTLAAHKRHIRHGEVPCDLCRLAARVDRGFRRKGSAWEPSDRSAWLVYRAALDALLAEPERVVDELRSLLGSRRQRGDATEPHVGDRWDRLLDGPILELASVMVGLDDDAKTLRASAPVDGVVRERRRPSAPVRNDPRDISRVPDIVRPTSRSRASTPPPNWCEHTGPASGVVELPFHLYWSDDNNRFDLSKRPRLRSMYQTVLTEGSAHDVREYLNLPLLLDVWDELWLSPAVHEAWDGWIEARRHAAV